MTKRRLHDTKNKIDELAADTLPNPANFPVGSLQSRAAARILASKQRPGDEGVGTRISWPKIQTPANFSGVCSPENREIATALRDSVSATRLEVTKESGDD
jgi:hypothetical protein